MVDLAEDLASPPGSPVTVDTAFGVDWPNVVAGPDDRGHMLAPAEVRNEDFDVSSLPDNAIAIIRHAWVAFKCGGAGAVDTQNYGVIVVLRDSTGALTTSLSSWASMSAGVGAGGWFTLSNITTPDPNTVRMEFTNGADSTYLALRFAISIITSGAPVAPP